jgi:hypothetical protein
VLLGWYSETRFIRDFWDKAEELPGCFMIQREIRRAISGEPFFFNDEESGKSTRVEGCGRDEFNYYFQIWDDFHWLKILPHGKGTLSERRWVLDLIKIFEKSHAETLGWIEARETRKAEAKYKKGAHPD